MLTIEGKQIILSSYINMNKLMQLKNRFTISVNSKIAKFIYTMPAQKRSKIINEIIEKEIDRQAQVSQFRKKTMQLPDLSYLKNSSPTPNRKIEECQ